MPDDKLFEARDGRDPFRFDEDVARVFPDMLKRSIPGYEASIEAIGSLAARFVKPGTRCYDLGCSLGAATLAMRQGARTRDIDIIAIDTAEAMVSRCRDATADDDRIQIEAADIRDAEIENADASSGICGEKSTCSPSSTPSKSSAGLPSTEGHCWIRAGKPPR